MSTSDNNSASGDSAEIERYCATCDRSYPDGWSHCPEDGTTLIRLAARKDPLIGKVIDGRFTIRARIGAGGMGAVYEGWQASIGRTVAIKVIETRLSNDRVASKRFLRESKLLSQLSQPNTVTVIDFGQTDEGMLYLAMELIKGRTLSAVLKESGALPVHRVARIGYQLCDALDAAHGMSIIHRDLKPANVMVLDHPPGRDFIKVLDFGLAKSLIGEGDHAHSTVTRSDVILGTPSYISPELIAGNTTDARADLYSVGVLLYEMLSGRLPFLADTVNVLLAKHAYEEPDPLDESFPAPVREVIMRLLSKAPESRYQSAAETRAALQYAVEGILSERALTTPSGPVPAYATPVDSGAAMTATVDAHSRGKGAAASSPDTAVHAAHATHAREERSKRRAGLWIAGVLVVASAAAGIAFATMRSRGSSTPAQSTSGATAGADDSDTSAGVGGADLAPGAAAAVVAPAIDAGIAMVAITETSTPGGAAIKFGGEDMGKTPTTFSVPKSATGTELELSLSKYTTEKAKVTPSADQKLDYRLTRSPRHTKPPTPSTPKDPPPVPFVLPGEK